jgi:hypothetical protein
MRRPHPFSVCFRRAATLLCIGTLMALAAHGCAPVDGPAEKPQPKVEARPAPLPAPAVAAKPSGNEPLIQQRIETALQQVRQRELLLSNGFWTVFHGILGLGPELTLMHPQLRIQVNALDYICQGYPLRGLHFIPTAYGVDVETGETFVSQGHQDQFLAEMAQCGVAGDRRFVVEGKPYTFMDFVRNSQMRARVSADQELSWTLIVVGQYLGTDVSWTNSAGESLKYDDLVRYEVDANVEQAACGGTHRLFGLRWAYNLHARKGGQPVGVWKDVLAEQAKYQQFARAWQNPDGSFSTSFFRGPGAAPDMQLRMNTTGHILEWLAYSMPKSELRQEWMERAVNRLVLMFFEIQSQPMESGTLYHAMHGLRIYHERLFGSEGLGPNKPFLILADDAGP